MKGRSAAEFAGRTRQQIIKLAERAGVQTRMPEGVALSLFLYPRFTAESWRAHWNTGMTLALVPGLDDLNATADEFRRRFGSVAQTAVVERALAIGHGQIDLLGLEGLDVGAAVDWHTEPLSGLRSPLIHWSKFKELDSSSFGDKKIIWELNRCQHFIDLGRAYVLTRDERFAKKFALQLASWMNQNPPKKGVNWVSSLEVSFRAIAWLWALRMFRDSTWLSAELLWRAMSFLYLHARHLEQYLSTYSSPNTHLTGEALGLFYLGVALPEFLRAKRWRTTGLAILNDAIKKQVRDDGVYFEQSTYYHRYTTDFYLHLMILSRRKEVEFDPETKRRLEQMLNHLLYIARPDGTTPLIGDDDGGRLVPLGACPRDDFRATLGTGAVMFGRPDLKWGAGEMAEETLWLLGVAGAREFDSLEVAEPADLSVGFPAAGIYVMRDGWDLDSTSLVVDSGPHGALSGGHGHADALSFDLTVRGRPTLVDPGTFTYTGSEELREYFRSTAAHNTLTIDGESSSVPAGPFSWRSMTDSKTTHWIDRDRFGFIVGTHDGYKKLAPPGVHTRSFLFLHNDYLIMRDQVTTKGAHRFELNFHGAPGLTCAEGEGGVTFSQQSYAAEPVLDLVTCANREAAGDWTIEGGFVSRCYQSSEAAPVAVYGIPGTGAMDLITFMLPRSGEPFPRVVESTRLSGGQYYSLKGIKGHDALLLSFGAQLKHAGLCSDFQWAWCRFSENGALVEVVLLEGTDFRVQGEVLFGGRGRVAFAHVNRVAGKWVIETNTEMVSRASSDTTRGDVRIPPPSEPYVRD